MILTLYWLYVDRVRLVLGTSTNLDTARESWEKAVSLAEDNPTLASEVGDVRRTNGEQTLTTVWGGRYKIAASNRKGGRGLTIDRLVLDELREHAHWDSYNAAVPAMNAVPDATAFFISNQGDDKSQVLNALRDQALEGSDERLGLFEWSSEDGMDPTDPEALAMANPSLGRRIFLDTLMGDAIRAKQAGGEQLADFLTEVHCRRVPLLNPAIDLDAWSRSYSAENSLEAFKDKLALCVDVSFDQTHATLYAAAVDGERVRVDPVAAWEGQDAISQMSSQLPALVEKMKPRVLGWFPDGPAAAALPALTPRQGWPPAGVTVEAIRQVTAVCMGFAEQVRSDKVYHSGDPLLDAHVRAAEKLSYGDGWRFTRRKAGHVDAAYAAAGAVHLARTLQDESEPMIF
ncbi:MAG TPA: hypothetical protein VEA63_06960 [Opitutus sp.]|nr:hypothetical protein [Opitutus sp.]